MAINSLSAASRGMSGLVSGMDTQQMVEAMLSGTQNKIDTTKQKKTQLGYKQEIYRGLTTKLLNFQNSFFKFGSSSTNLLSDTFFNSMSAKTASNAFKVTANSTASAGKTTVNYIKSLAQAERIKSTKNATGKLEGDFDAAKMKALADKMNESVQFKAEDGTVLASVSIKELVGNGSTPNGSLAIEQVLKGKLKDVANVSFEDGTLMIASKDGKKITVGGDTSALKMFGLTSERTSSDVGKIGLSIDPTAALPKLDVTVNGVKKTVTFNPISDSADGTWNAADFASRMQDTLQKAFGTKVQVTNESGNKVRFWMQKGTGTDEDTSSEIKLASDGQTGGTELMKTFGITSGKSNKINTGMTLAAANFAEPILGGVQKFTINGVDFSVNSNQSIYEVMNQINSSNAGVTISYQATEDRFVMESKVSGKLAGGTADTTSFTMSQTEGNLLTAMFGVDRSGNFSTHSMTGSGAFTGTEFDASAETFTDQTVTLKIGDSVQSFQVKFQEGDKKDAATFIKRLNEVIKKNDDVKDKISIGYEITNSKGKLKFVGANGTEVQVVSGLDKLGVADGSRSYTGIAKEDSSMSVLGFKPWSVDADGKSQGLKVTIGTQTVKMTADDTVESFRAKLDQAVKNARGLSGEAAKSVGAEFDKNTGRYRIFGVDIPMAMKVEGDDGKLMGTNEPIQIGQTGLNADLHVQQGQNAIVKINGVEIERTSNNFTLDGVTYELRNTTTEDANETFEVTRDTDKIYEGITKFVEEYNKLVDSINEQLSADATYRDYPPLTDKQKEAMSDREVELWEEKSKGGLLRNDSALERVMNGLRETLHTKPAGGMSLYQLGIQANSFYSERDHLTIDDPAKLKQQIAENPTMVQALFTDAEKGLGQLMNNAITKAASTNPGSPGILVREAGATGRVDTSSSIYRQVRDLNDRLSTLENTYESQYNRYWKQYNSMEQLISQMNQQSTWLSQQFS